MIETYNVGFPPAFNYYECVPFVYLRLRHVRKDQRDTSINQCSLFEVGCYFSIAGIQYLREYLHLPQEIVPATLKRPVRTEGARPRPKGGCLHTSSCIVFMHYEIMYSCEKEIRENERSRIIGRIRKREREREREREIP